MTAQAHLVTKLRKSLTTIAITGLALVATSCAQNRAAPAAGQDPVVISQATDGALQKYLDLIYPNKRGAFAISADGANSYTYYCPEISCTPSLFGNLAVRQCESLSGQPCYLFYAAQEPRMAYTVATAKGVTGRHALSRGVPTEELPVFFNRD